MRLPRFILNPSVSGWIRLLQRERKENIRLRLELLEWKNRTLEGARIRPLFQPPPKPIEQSPRPPVGLADKKRQLAERQSDIVPSAEDILLAAENAKSNGR